MLDPDALHERIKKRKKQWEDERLAPPRIRLWDGDYVLRGEVAGELAGGFKFEENETGTAWLRLPIDHYLALWVTNHRGRTKKNVHVTFDKQGARWSGFMDNYKLVKTKAGEKYLEITFKHDYEHLKHIRCWSNPFLPAELQFPRLWMIFGKSDWALGTTLLANITRLESSAWMLPDDPMDKSQWNNMDQSTWQMIVAPIDHEKSTAPPTVVFSRFKSFHDVAKRVLADAQLTIECRRFLAGEDEPPWEGANLRHGCLVFSIVDKSHWNTETSFGGDLINGLIRAFTNIGEDGLTENRDIIPNPNFPPEYFDPNFQGTLPQAPWVVFEEGPYTGIESSEFIYYPATDVQVVTGGHSAPGVNEGISAAIIAIGGFLGSLFGQSQIGPAIDAVLKPLYTDTVLAFMAWKSPERAQDLGAFHLQEKWADGADRAYTLAALIALRSGMWSTREHTAHTLRVPDAAPYRVGDRGHGDFFIGDRVATAVLGQPEYELYVERVMALSYEWDKDGPSGWIIDIGHREPEDPFLKAMELIQELTAGLEDLGVL